MTKPIEPAPQPPADERTKCGRTREFNGGILTCVYQWGHAGNHAADGYRWSPEASGEHTAPPAAPPVTGDGDESLVHDLGRCLDCGAPIGQNVNCNDCRCYAAGLARGRALGARDAVDTHAKAGGPHARCYECCKEQARRAGGQGK